eukprot:363736-Chlamydomonas_euryale.AAC.4
MADRHTLQSLQTWRMVPDALRRCVKLLRHSSYLVKGMHAVVVASVAVAPGPDGLLQRPTHPPRPSTHPTVHPYKHGPWCPMRSMPCDQCTCPYNVYRGLRPPPFLPPCCPIKFHTHRAPPLGVSHAKPPPLTERLTHHVRRSCTAATFGTSR